MTDAAIILDVFFRAGYGITAIVLGVVCLLAPRWRATRLVRPANGLLAFYALCMLLIDIVALVMGYAHHASSVSTNLPHFLVYNFLPFAAVVLLFLSIKRHPQWLLAPFALLVNYSWIGTDQLIAKLFELKPYVLVLMGLLYLLVVFLLYILGVWARRMTKEDVSV